MAIRFAHVEIIAPSKGRSPVVLAAYITRGERTRDLTGEPFDFTKYKSHEVVLTTGLDLPANAPRWSSKKLWDEAERAEIAKKHLSRTGEIRFKENAQTAKHCLFALPINPEMTQELLIKMSMEIVKNEFTSNGLPAEWAIHLADGNIHLHVLTSTRRLNSSGFDKHKARDLNPTFANKSGCNKGWVSESDQLNQRYEDFQNSFFAKNGLAITVDPQSIFPQVNEGKARFIKDSIKSQINKDAKKSSQRFVRENYLEVLRILTLKEKEFSIKKLATLIATQGFERDEVISLSSAIINEHCSFVRVENNTKIFAIKDDGQENFGEISHLERMLKDLSDANKAKVSGIPAEQAALIELEYENEQALLDQYEHSNEIEESNNEQHQR